MSIFYCHNCSEEIDLQHKFCHNCRSEILKCSICYNPFEQETKLAICPYCRSLFHTEHIKSWYEINSQCPHCKKHVELQEYITIPISSFREFRFDLDEDGKYDTNILSYMEFQKRFWRSQKLILNKFEEKVSKVERKFYVVSPPGSGKTIIGLEIIKRLATNVLVLTPNFSVQQQWIDKLKLFLEEDSPVINTMLGSISASNKQPITVMTYQRFSVYERDLDILYHYAENLWISENQERIEEIKKNYPKIHKKPSTDKEFLELLSEVSEESYLELIQPYVNKIRHQILKNKIDSTKISIRDILHQNTKEIIDTLKEKGIGLIILDECHHLTAIWAHIVNYLIDEFNMPFVVGLTATPPLEEFDEDIGGEGEEKSIYKLLFGKVDIEIPTPAAVKQGNLCPYQDLLYLTEPTRQDLKLVEEEINEIISLIQVDRYKTIHSPNSWILKNLQKESFSETIKEYTNNKLISDNLLFKLKKKIRELEEKETEENETNSNYSLQEYHFSRIERVFLLYMYFNEYLNQKAKENEQIKEYQIFQQLETIFQTKNRKETNLLFEKGGVFDIFSKSEAKLKAAIDILKQEYANLGHNLRAIIIFDYRERESTFKLLEDISHENKIKDLDPVIISSSSIFIDKDIAEKVITESKLWKKRFRFDFEITYSKTNSEGIYEISGGGTDWRTGIYTLLFTYLFEKGITKCLIGPYHIFGEGWDSVKLNTLIDLTSVAAYQTVVQTKGRAYRYDEEFESKISNIWDVAVVDKSIPYGLSDFNNIIRKHEHFYGLSEDGVIEKGIGHIYPSITEDIGSIIDHLNDFNLVMKEKASKRQRTYDLWRIGESYENIESMAYNIKITPTKSTNLTLRDDYDLVVAEENEIQYKRQSIPILQEKKTIDILKQSFKAFNYLDELLQIKEETNEELSKFCALLQKSSLSERSGNYIRLQFPSIESAFEEMMNAFFFWDGCYSLLPVNEFNNTHIKDEKKIGLLNKQKFDSLLETVFYFGLPQIRINEATILHVIWSRIVSVGYLTRKKDVESFLKTQYERIKTTKKITWR